MLKSPPINIEAIIKEKGIELNKAADIEPDVVGLIKKEDGKYKILINRLAANCEKRFIMAHILAHFVLHKDAIDENGIDESHNYRTLYQRSDKVKEPQELEANNWAVNLLMPKDLILEYAQGKKIFLEDGKISPNFLRDISNFFEVPRGLMEKRFDFLDLQKT